MFQPYLKTFITVVESGSFSKAANALYLSRASVMRQVNALEERVGTPLLVRQPSGITLSEAGASFYEDALRLLRESDEAIERARKISEKQICTILVGTSVLNPCQPLLSIWEDIKEDYPSLRLRAVPYSDDHNEILSRLSSLGTNFDLFMGIHDSKAWEKHTRFLPVSLEPIRCAVPISHPLASRSSLKITDFDGQVLMMVSDGDSPGNSRARRLLRQACPSLTILDVGNYYDLDVFHTCVERNCLLLSFDMWGSIHPSLVTIPIEWDCRIPYGIVYSQTPSKEVSAFIEAVHIYLQESNTHKNGGKNE